jgi:hypothetical protein
MSSVPMLTVRPPIRWIGCINLLPEEAKSLLLLIPEGLQLATELRLTLDEAVARAEQLNLQDKGGQLWN